MKYRFLLFFSLLISLFFCYSVSAAADDGFPDAAPESALQLCVRLFDAEDARADVLELPGYPDAPYYLFLPANCDRARLRVDFPAASLTVNGQALTSGGYTDAFAEDGAYTVEADGKTYPLQVVSSASLPSVFITTESGSLNDVHADKSHKETGALTLARDGGVELRDAKLAYIKGRGNTSWRMNEKRSYNIKFEEKTSLLGMKAAKKWVLTSNNTDPTLMRNAVIYKAAQFTRLPFTVDFRFVDLYVNGNYRGQYMLCEKIEIQKNRIELPDLDDANKEANPAFDAAAENPIKEAFSGGKISYSPYANEPADITGGYLLEFEYPDQFDAEPGAFLTKNGQCLILHSPEYATKAEIEYIAALYGDLEEALLSEDGRNSQGKTYTDYLDMDSFIDGILLHEFAKNRDLGHTSWYLFVPQGESRFYMGPLWDFDSGMDDSREIPDFVRFLAEKELHVTMDPEDATFISLLCSHRDFVEAMRARFPALEEILTGEFLEQVSALFADNEKSAIINRLRWGDAAYAETETARMRSYTTERTAFLHSFLSDDLDRQVEEAKQRIRDEETASANAEKEYRLHKWGIPLICIVIAVVLILSAAVLIGIRRKKSKQIP